MIEIKNVSKRFNEFSAVKNINISIKKGEIVGLLGPNGAGKTTTMRMITGYYKPTEGEIIIDGKSVLENKMAIQKSIGYLPENSSLYTDMLVCDYLNFIALSYQISESDYLNNLDYAVTATGLEKYFYRPVSHLSKGYKQRVGIAATLIHNPSILILDEPTSGLDPNQIIEIQNLIKNLAKDKTIILSTHILKEVENTCQRAIIISEGQIVLDEPLQNLSSLRKKGFKIHLTLAGKIDNAVNILGSALNITDISSSPTEENETKILINSAEHLGEKIYHCSVENKWTLKELFAEKESLENIFQALTGVNQ
jgi:ABC-2 type transport system ATP-binding protein